MEAEKVFSMPFCKGYALLSQKAKRKGRTQQEVDEIVFWLTGYSKEQLDRILKDETDYRTFFEQAPKMNPNCDKIKGVICGIRVEEIKDPLMQKIRYLDKLVDELAKGKALEKILRK